MSQQEGGRDGEREREGWGEREGGMGRENERQYDASATFCPNLLLSPILC